MLQLSSLPFFLSHPVFLPGFARLGGTAAPSLPGAGTSAAGSSLGTRRESISPAACSGVLTWVGDTAGSARLRGGGCEAGQKQSLRAVKRKRGLWLRNARGLPAGAGRGCLQPDAPLARMEQRPFFFPSRCWIPSPEPRRHRQTRCRTLPNSSSTQGPLGSAAHPQSTLASGHITILKLKLKWLTALITLRF